MIAIVLSRIVNAMMLIYIFANGLHCICRNSFSKNDFIFMWIIALSLQLQGVMRLI